VAVGADPGAVPVAVYLTDLLLKMKRAEDALKAAQQQADQILSGFKD